MAIPQPKPRDWQIANAKELQITDRQVLQLLRDAKRNVDAILKDLPEGSVKRAQLEHTRSLLLAQQSTLFERLGDTVAARRAAAASRSARLSAASDAALLKLVGKSAEAQYLYDSALQVGQRAIDAAMQRMRLSALPLSQRIYNTSVWMNGRLGKLINETLASGLDAKAFAKRARDWFNPNIPGGVRYAAMRLARTEINNAFHSISAEKYATTPWCTEVDWNLSKSHPKPDICNKVAADSPFPKDEVPARPHPQCMCYITAKYVDEKDFIDNFLKGDYDEYLDAELEKNGWQEPAAKQPPLAIPAVATNKPQPEIAIPVVAPEAPKPVFDQQGYQPGNWELKNDNEAQLLEIQADLKKANPALTDAMARTFAEKFVSGTTSDNDVLYRNGTHEVRFSAPVSEEDRLRFLTDFDYLQSTFPAGHAMTVTVAPSTDFGFNVGGETTLGTGAIFINARVLTQKVWPGMPASANVSSSRYVLAHEWGHAVSTPEEAREKHVHNTAIKAGGLSRYGTVGADGVLAPAEGYAEAFAEWTLTNGKTTNPATLEYAKHFHWGERFGTH